MEEKKLIPVILDTDIGDDIDDSWAIIFMLNSPELDIKLINVALDSGNKRAAMVAEILELAGRTDIPIGIGCGTSTGACLVRNEQWVTDFDVLKYSGEIYDDGIEEANRLIMDSEEPITLIAIAPPTNINEMLLRSPEIAAKTNFVGMQGAIYKGYNGTPEVEPEYNAALDVSASSAVLSAPWHSFISTPLDTCGLVVIDGESFVDVSESDNPLLKYIIECYKTWNGYYNKEQSSVLFDTVAVFLAFSHEYLGFEELNVKVDNTGITKISDDGQQGTWAVYWEDFSGYMSFLIDRLKGK